MRSSSLSGSSNSFISSFCVTQSKGKRRKICSIPSHFAIQSFQFTLTKSEREAKSLCHQYLENSDVTASVIKQNFRFRVSSILFPLTLTLTSQNHVIKDTMRRRTDFHLLLRKLITLDNRCSGFTCIRTRGFCEISCTCREERYRVISNMSKSALGSSHTCDLLNCSMLHMNRIMALY